VVVSRRAQAARVVALREARDGSGEALHDRRIALRAVVPYGGVFVALGRGITGLLHHQCRLLANQSPSEFLPAYVSKGDRLEVLVTFHPL
jgi:hypothetical protein